MRKHILIFLILSFAFALGGIFYDGKNPYIELLFGGSCAFFMVVAIAFNIYELIKFQNEFRKQNNGNKKRNG